LNDKSVKEISFMIAPTRFSVARLGSTQQQTLQELEAQFRCLIVAYQQEAELAQLAPEGYAKLCRLENELGVALVAYEPTARFELAQPSQTPLERLRAMERELGLILVAYAQERAAPMPAQMPAAAGAEQLATLSEEQFDKLHTVEEKTGLVLMAYKSVA
jgi:hypothetical protein